MYLGAGESEAVRRSDEEAAVRRQFEMDAVWSRMIAPGGRIPDLPLIEVDLGPIHLRRLLDTGPLVLVFIRYAGSAACEETLVAYERTLAPACADLDAHLVAVSPQRAELLAPAKHRNDLSYLVAADPRHSLIDAFGIGYPAPEAIDKLGTRRAVLPYPSVVVADRAGTVRYADVHPFTAARTPAARIIATLRQQICSIPMAPRR
ncbi:peroxiredoxin-like family protein [Amorphoplanes nipponensis]|uniref:Peroxiredoxin n=1 Tax=Actinoplanes nipponensis TaxID=135950 RepID=A0A919JLQ8_9ACTN|nr:peroxiredoxin [Actinoplanes nipponensis]